jgi:hypothetical protein
MISTRSRDKQPWSQLRLVAAREIILSLQSDLADSNHSNSSAVKTRRTGNVQHLRGSRVVSRGGRDGRYTLQRAQNSLPCKFVSND